MVMISGDSLTIPEKSCITGTSTSGRRAFHPSTPKNAAWGMIFSGARETTFHFYPTLPDMLGAPLIRYQVVQMREPSDQRLLTLARVMESLHRKQLPVDSVMRLIQQRAGHRHLRDCGVRLALLHDLRTISTFFA
jgi:hypothetical protein